MTARVLPIDPDAFPRIVASATLKIKDRALRIARLDDVEGYGPAIVFVGEPVPNLLAGEDSEPYMLAHVQAIDEDGQVVSAFFADECFEQLVFLAGRTSDVIRPADADACHASRTLVHGLLNMIVEREVR